MMAGVLTCGTDIGVVGPYRQSYNAEAGGRNPKIELAHSITRCAG
jgi:DNA-binding XRE family transcriptional regulator